MHSVDAQPDVEAFRNVCADGAFDGHGVGSVPGSAFTPVDPTNAAAVQPALWALPSPVVCGNEDVVQAAGMPRSDSASDGLYLNIFRKMCH